VSQGSHGGDAGTIDEIALVVEEVNVDANGPGLLRCQSLSNKYAEWTHLLRSDDAQGFEVDGAASTQRLFKQAGERVLIV
jgi:hypothetical protein